MSTPSYYSLVATAALLSSLWSASAAIVDPTTYFDSVTTDRSPYETFVTDLLDYDKHQFLSTTANRDEGMAVFWKIHNQPQPGVVAVDITRQSVEASPLYGEEGWIQFAVVVRATSWVSLGVSYAGGMYGSDMAIFDTQVSMTEMLDGYVVDTPVVQMDDCGSDWTLVNDPILEDGWMIVEFSRLLDTKDESQDVPLVHDTETLLSAPTRLIAAWGDSDTGIGYHGTKRALSAVKLFSPPSESSTNSDGSLSVYKGNGGGEISDTEQELEAISDGSFEMRESDFTIPPVDTTYHDVCFSRQDILDAYEGEDDEDPSLTLVGILPIISPETAQYIHHFTVISFSDPAGCASFSEFSGFVNGWAPGENGMVYPENVGMTLLGDSDIQSLKLEIHYNNPQEDVGQLDSSGIRLYISNTTREHELTTLQLGDPFVLLREEAVGGEGLTNWEFNCAASCSATALIDGEPVTVIAESLHMHTTGTRMVNQVIRDNEVVHESKIDIYDFDQQGLYRAPIETYQIEPGDAFRTVCTYQNGTKFGFSSQDEMCVAYLTYYPAKKILGASPWLCANGIGTPICEEETTNSTITEAELGRQFGVSRTDQCPGAVEGGEEEQAGEEGGVSADESESAPSSAASVTVLYGMLTVFTLGF